MYDYYEYLYRSSVFEKSSTSEVITLIYSFYQVHSGTVSFAAMVADDLMERLDDTVSTYDLLRVMQAYSEIASKYPKLFMQMELIFKKRFNQMSVDEMTTCASGFAISGFGTPLFFKMLEQGIMFNLPKFSTESLKEVCRGFLFSLRGSKLVLQMLLPRLEPILSEFTSSELCYMIFAFHEGGYLPKAFARQIEAGVKPRLLETDDITPQELVLLVNVFCETRTASRDFHKLLETVILMRL